jgi:vacuolar protein sorting-associated protein VTA1
MGRLQEVLWSGYALPPGYTPPLPAVLEAQKAAKCAVSSLSFEDVSSAVKFLNDALRLLTVPGAHK